MRNANIFKKIKKAIGKIKKIDPRNGAGTAMYYLAILVVITISVVLLTEYLHAYSSIGHTQIYADLLANGSAYVGNTGWGLDRKEAKTAYQSLIKYNESEFTDITPAKTPSFKYTDLESNDKTAEESAKNKDSYMYNTVITKTKSTASTLTTQQTIGTDEVSRSKAAVTQIAYSGGMRICLEAYHHTYEYEKLSGKDVQVHYRWAGGHDPLDRDAWKNFADCSGFVDGVYHECGYDIGPYATPSLEQTGKLVGTGWSAILNDARPGDIILIWYSGSAAGASQHTGIYAGMYNGTPYWFESRGGSALIGFTKIESGSNANGGQFRGAHIDPVNPRASHYMVRRVVHGNANPYASVPEKKIGSLDDNQSKLYNLLNSLPYGFNDAQIFAIMGCWQQESGCDPDAIEIADAGIGKHWPASDKEGFKKAVQSGRIDEQEFCAYTTGYGRQGYGLGQWTTTSSADRRVYNLVNWAKTWKANTKETKSRSKVGPVWDMAVQVSFAMQEMGGRINEYKRYTGNSIERGVNWWLTNFEGVPGNMESQRVAYAYQISAAAKHGGAAQGKKWQKKADQEAQKKAEQEAMDAQNGLTVADANATHKGGNTSTTMNAGNSQKKTSGNNNSGGKTDQKISGQK